MVDTLRAAVSRFGMLADGDAVSVALSGGADSVALLHALLSLREQYGVLVSACHVNHNLRGGDSTRDEEFVRRLCGRFGVPLEVRSADVRALKKKHQSIEEAAREARYSVFSELAEKSGGRLKIATAHTASDNAETVLLNLIRGTALKGLRGIPPVRGNIIRPLILCARRLTEEYCRVNGLEYVADKTNLSRGYIRNRVRLSLVPLIRGINPSFEEGITRMCDVLRADEEFLGKAASEIMKNAEVDGGYDAALIKSAEKPLLGRVIGAVLSENGVTPSNLGISRVAALVAEGKGKINLKKDKFAVVSGNTLKIMTITQNYRKNKNKKLK
ncbi:MAG: tRNA lysidine(34) synthetase TilS [Oscillospiraceae bacterium]|jgi:tRNA(Ile)-lysidine synthase|nr:tRNA lysidine(34) synthetase TilS [Oscillospiraceae bacterium]